MNHHLPTHIETPDQKISPDEKDGDEQKLTPSEIVGAFMAGNGTFYDSFSIQPHRALSNDFVDLLDVIRNYEWDLNLSFESNVIEKMARINEYLDECLLEYVEEK